jgi:eukaryotic-like serine/threonine-protein kinase
VRPPGGLPSVKLLDFGMCRRNDPSQALDDGTLTRVGTVVGTPEYMAPEQAAGRRDFDLRIDIYAVGVMLYEMLTGTRAFHGSDPRAVLVAVLTRRLPSVRALRPELPSVVEGIVARAVTRDPRARYHDAGAFQHDLLEARTTMRRQRAALRNSQINARGDEWELPTRQLTPRHAFRRPA